MTRGLPYDQLVERLIRDDKNVLILDTCCLLDVIRCLPKGKMDVFDSALNISNAIEGNALDFSIVLPSLVPQEWENNIEAVMLETKRFINGQFNSLKNIRRILTETGSDVVLDFGAFNKL